MIIEWLIVAHWWADYAMQESRLAVIEGSLNTLAGLSVSSGGDFIAQRMKKEGLPVLHKLLKEGPALDLPKNPIHRPLIASYEPHAPAVILKTRHLILASITW